MRRNIARTLMPGQVSMAIGHQDRPVDDDEHEAVDVHQCVEDAEVEALAQRLLGRLHRTQQISLPGAVIAVNVGPVQMSQRPAESQEMVCEDSGPRDHGELEDQAPLAMVVVLFRAWAIMDLVVDDHARDSNQVGQSDSADVCQGILTNPPPLGVTDSQEDGLSLSGVSRTSDAMSAILACLPGTYMIFLSLTWSTGWPR